MYSGFICSDESCNDDKSCKSDSNSAKGKCSNIFKRFLSLRDDLTGNVTTFYPSFNLVLAPHLACYLGGI